MDWHLLKSIKIIFKHVQSKFHLLEANFEKLLALLGNTADKVLERMEFNKLMANKQVGATMKYGEVFLYTSPDKILGRIRPQGPQFGALTVPELMKTMRKDGTFPPTVLEALAKHWKQSDLMIVRDVIEKAKTNLSTEEKAPPVLSFPKKKEVDLFPHMPRPEDRDKSVYDWTAFGFLPKSRERMKEWLDQKTEEKKHARFGNHNAIHFEDWDKVAGRILPFRDFLPKNTSVEQPVTRPTTTEPIDNT